MLLLRAKIADLEEILFLMEGDHISFTLTKTETEKVYDIVSFVLPD